MPKTLIYNWNRNQW